MSQKSIEQIKYDCDQCEKSYVTNTGFLKHKQAKHSENPENSAIQEENEGFQEDVEFKEAVEDQEMYEMMEILEIFTKKAVEDGGISSNEINSLNAKLKRYRDITKKKTKIQEETSAELEKITKEKAKLNNEIERLKTIHKTNEEPDQQRKPAKQARSPLLLKFFKCSDCGNTFNSHNNLGDHINQSHNSQGDILCEMCGKILRDSSLMIKYHFQNDHDQNVTKNHASAKTPKTTHTVKTDKVTSSKTQSKEFPTVNNPNKTRKSFIVSTKLVGRSKPIKSSQEEFHCKFCGVKFADVDGLRNHVGSSHTHSDPSSSVYKCKFCVLTFNIINDLQDHIAAKHSATAQSCIICGYVYSDVNLLQYHIINAHTSDKIDTIVNECHISKVPMPQTQRTTIVKNSDKVSQTLEEVLKCQLCKVFFSKQGPTKRSH